MLQISHHSAQVPMHMKTNIIIGVWSPLQLLTSCCALWPCGPTPLLALCGSAGLVSQPPLWEGGCGRWYPATVQGLGHWRPIKGGWLCC
jgi:hypothetical protein